MESSERAIASDVKGTLPSSTLADDLASIKKDLESATGAEQDTNGENIATLVQQLDKATGVAQGVEGRLDKLLENLEQMLASLEKSTVEEEDTKHVDTSNATEGSGET